MTLEGNPPPSVRRLVDRGPIGTRLQSGSGQSAAYASAPHMPCTRKKSWVGVAPGTAGRVHAQREQGERDQDHDNQTRGSQISAVAGQAAAASTAVVGA